MIVTKKKKGGCTYSRMILAPPQNIAQYPSRFEKSFIFILDYI